MDQLQRPIVVPSVQVVMHCALRREVFREVTPLAARSEKIHNAVQDFADVDRALVTTRFGGWDQSLNLGPFLIHQVMSVAETATVMSKAGFVGPHKAPRDSVPRIDSQTIRAGQARWLTDSKDSICSRTDTKGLSQDNRIGRKESGGG
jgi:hypothetical protein